MVCCQPITAFYIGDLATEQGATDRLLELAYDAGDPWALTYALSLSATSSLFPGNYPEAQKLAEAAIKMGEESGEHFASIISILTLGHVAQVNEDYSTARKYYVSALEASRQLGFFWAIENATKYLGQVAFLEQRYEEAETRFISSLKIAYDFGLNRDIANHLYEFARLRPVQGKPGEAVALLTLLLKLPTSRQERMGEGSIRENAERLLRQLEMDLGPDEYSSAAQKGATLDLDETLQTLMAQENIS
jgi:tetratricopeptide (TPR) repeat protein